jgi:hypothetical protein
MVARKGYERSLSKQKNEEAAAPHSVRGHTPFQKGNVLPWFKLI